MSTNLFIHADLDLKPRPKMPELLYLTRGTTGYLKFDLLSKVYTFEDIEKAMFIFKQNDTIYTYELFDEDPISHTKTLNEHFSHEIGPDYDYISFLLGPTETLQFQPTTGSLPVLYEVMVKLDTDKFMAPNEDSTIVEPQFPIVVSDSLYGEYLDSIKN